MTNERIYDFLWMRPFAHKLPTNYINIYQDRWLPTLEFLSKYKGLWSNQTDQIHGAHDWKISYTSFENADVPIQWVSLRARRDVWKPSFEYTPTLKALALAASEGHSFRWVQQF